MTSDVVNEPTHQKAQPVRNVQRISAVIAAVGGALVLPSALGADDTVSRVFAWIVFVLSVAKVGLDAYQSQALPAQVVPFEDTAAYVDASGAQVAGPAAPQANGTAVEIVSAGDDTLLPDGRQL